MVENIVGKGEIARNERFLLFQPCFQNAFTADTKNQLRANFPFPKMFSKGLYCQCRIKLVCWQSALWRIIFYQRCRVMIAI